MKKQMWQIGLTGVALAALLAACGKPPAQTSAAPPTAPTHPQPLPADPTGSDNTMPVSSETIATNTPDPECHDCKHPDAGTTGAPAKPLDPVFAEELKLTIGLTCQVLEDGVTILEKNAKDPGAAEAALKAYREKNKAHMAEIGVKTRAVAQQLKDLGYESDIPAEVKADYEARMGKALARLEKVRAAYAKYTAVLEAFGPFIRIGE